MNTAALKTFAPAVRTQLLAAVALKLDYVLSARTPDYVGTYAPQVGALRRLAATDRAGLVERVAYTWFNRFAALRFIDARGWHPFRARVLTPATGDTQPELLKVVRAGAMPEELRRHTNPARLADLLDGRVPSSNAQSEVYRHLVLAACRYYNALLPDIFARLDDETELLLPDDLLTEHSVVQGFRTDIRDEDCGDAQRANVEVLGWLYQFYISERKDQVMARKSAVSTSDVPAVTQLFTPHWIVRYLVENSLGRLWMLNRPGSRLRSHMPYYIEGGADSDFLKITKPEDIRVCDPAAGSGHMLTYAFDLLTLIYEEEGYAQTEIPALILRYNLHGLDICPRAAQLAELALVFKARERSRRFFQPEHLVRPRITELRDVCFSESELDSYARALEMGDLFSAPMYRLLRRFEDAKNFGSLIQPGIDELGIASTRQAIEAKDLGGKLFLRDTHLKVLRVLDQAEALSRRYHVVVANPPYMGSNQMPRAIKDFGVKVYAEAKADMFAMFILRCATLSMARGYAALITMQSWMFLGSYAKLREKLLDEHAILSMLHLGARAFDTISGEVVQTTAFAFQVDTNATSSGVYFRLVDERSETTKSNRFLDALIAPQRHGLTKYSVPQQALRGIQGAPIAYWLSVKLVQLFSAAPPLTNSCSSGFGIKTGDNPQFMRLWTEVSASAISFSTGPGDSLSHVWYPCTSGGSQRKWYGNGEMVVNFKDGGKAIQLNAEHTGVSYGFNASKYYFRECISWSKLGSGSFYFRYTPKGCIFDGVGLSAFFKEEAERASTLAYLNSIVAAKLIDAIAPALSLTSGDFLKLPSLGKRIDASRAAAAVRLAHSDWDNFETSWDFHDLPFLRTALKAKTLEATWRAWEAQSSSAIRRMQELETENNRLFIAACGLEGELHPEVPEDQITLARADVRRDVAAFLSYAVGCMMGRYSLDHPGLVLADAGDTLREYLAKVGRTKEQLTFAPDEDGIVPVLDGEWFADDVVSRTRDFLRATFGEATLRENLSFIEESLGKDLRKYFLTDFYKDHLQTYKKRPIYWMVQSPKRGFAVLVYLHRYTRDSLNLVLNRYLREYQAKLTTRIAALAQAQVSATAAAAKTEARRESDKLTKVLLECQEWERQALLPLAQARLALDLDDGVKVNYLKLAEVLAPIAGLAAAED